MSTPSVNVDEQQNIMEEIPSLEAPHSSTKTKAKNTTTAVKENSEPPVVTEQTLPLPPAVEEQQLSDFNDLWEPLEQGMVFEDFPPEQDLPFSQAIRLSAMDMIGTLKEGDKVSLPLIEGEEYTATITETKNFENGSSSMTGQYEVNGENYTITLTQGVKTSFGTFTTPYGTYQISLVGGKGYLYSSDEMDAKRIDTKKTDVLIPENG